MRWLITSLVLVLLCACASQSETLDPAQLEEQIALYRTQEIDLVRSTILEQSRADQFIQLLDERDQLIARYVVEIDKYRQEMTALNANYHAERGRFDTLMADYYQGRANAQLELIALIESMKELTEENEWKVISRFQLKRLNVRELTYGRVSGDA
jgi:hypothetical protein